MCIINLTSIQEIDTIIQQFTPKINFSDIILGVFTPSQSIQNIIEVKHSFSFIIIHINSKCIDAQLIYSMDNVNRFTIDKSLERFEEFILQNQ